MGRLWPASKAFQRCERLHDANLEQAAQEARAEAASSPPANPARQAALF